MSSLQKLSNWTSSGSIMVIVRRDGHVALRTRIVHLRWATDCDHV